MKPNMIHRGQYVLIVKIEGLDRVDDSLECLKKIVEFKQRAKTDYLMVKCMSAAKEEKEIRRWFKSVNPKEYFIKWRPADSDYSDDSIEVHYIPSKTPEAVAV